MARQALAGKVVVVPVVPAATGATGATDLARRLAAEGAAVVLVAGPDTLEEAGRLASAIQADGAGRAAVFALDSADPGGLDALVELVAELWP